MRSVIALKVTLEGDETDLKNSSSHRITAQGALLGAIRTLSFLMSLKIGSFHTFLTVTVRAFFFFLRAGRQVFLQKTEKKIIAPLSSVALCVLFDSFLAWYSLAAVLRTHFVQVRQLCTIILFAYRCAWLGKGKVNFFSAEHIEEQQTRIREEISREYEDFLFTGKKDSNFDRDCQFIFPKELAPPPSQPVKFRLSPFPYLRFVVWLVLWLFWPWLTSIYLTSPFHLQPSGELGHVTTRERTSRFIKLSGNICIQIKETFSVKKMSSNRSSTG